MSWWDGHVAGLDTETTGKDAMTARLVTADVVQKVGTGLITEGWIVAVDEEIPQEATGKHGVTTEHAQTHGRPLPDVLTEISVAVCRVWRTGVPLVIYNAPYDLTVINQERARCGRLQLRFTETSNPILDPMVIDRALDKYRKGSRTLEAVAKHYGVTLDNAHTSSADALAAVEVMLRMAEVFPQLKRMSLQALYRTQAVWRAQWAQGYQVYLRNKMTAEGADPHEIANTVIDQSWPVRIPADAHPDGPMRVGGRQR